MKDNVQISVILPVYNAAQYLKETIESVLTQTFSDFELIIINDGSTDESESIAISFEDKRIIYIKNPINLGLIATLNKGIDLSTGKYIARMDADDICLPQRFEKQWNLMESNLNLDVCGSSITYFNTTGNLKNWDVPLSDKLIKTQLLVGPGFSHPTVFLRTSSLKQQQIYYSKDYIHAEDYELWVRLATLGFQFQNIKEPLLYYRIHEENVSKTNQGTQKLIHSKIQQQQFENFLKRPLNHHELTFFKPSNIKLPASIYLETVVKFINEMVRKNKKINYFDEVNLIKTIKYFMFSKLDFSGLSILNLFSIGFKTPSEFGFCFKKYLKTKSVS